MKKTKISVVIPTYNRSTELRRALKGVESQTLRPHEVVICDDGSSEDIFSVVDCFKNTLPIRCIRIDNSGSPARPRNVGVNASTGEWIAFLDSDDWWHPNKLQIMSQHVDKADILYHRLTTVDQSKWFGLHSRVIGWDPPSALSPAFDLLTTGNPIPTSSSMICRSLYQELNGMEEGFKTIEDYDFWIRVALFKSPRFYFEKSILGCYSVTPMSFSSNALQQAQMMEQIFSRYIEYFSPGERVSISSYRDFCIGVNLIAAGDVKDAMRFLGMAQSLRTKKQRASRLVKLTKFAFLKAIGR